MTEATEVKISEYECPKCGWRHQRGGLPLRVKIIAPPDDVTRGVFEPGVIGVNAGADGDPVRYVVRIGAETAWFWPCQLEELAFDEEMQAVQAEWKAEPLTWRRGCTGRGMID